MEAPKQRQAFGMAVAACVVLFAAFAGAWWMLTRTVRDSEAYAVTVPQYLAAGEPGRAVAVARVAAERDPIDAAAAHLYAKALMAAGKTDAALGQYGRLFNIAERHNPAYDPSRPSAEPPTLATRRPHFAPEARLEMAEYWFGNGQLQRAIEHIELAQAYAQTISPDYRTLVSEAYGAVGARDRAFAYAGDGVAAFSTLHKAFLVERESDNIATLVWVGRAGLAGGHAERAAEALSTALDQGHPDAAFFLGLAREALGMDQDLVALYLRTSPDSLFRPFALAKALDCLDARTGTGQPGVTAERASIEDELRTHFSGDGLPLPRPYMPEQMDVRPVGFALDTSAGEPVQLAVLWMDERRAASADAGFVLEDAGPDRWVLAHGQRVLEVRFITNQVPFGAFDRWLAADARGVPGWPAIYTTPADAVDTNAFEVGKVGDDIVLRIRAEDPGVTTGLRTMPLGLGDARHYLLAVRCKSEAATLYAGWDWYDAEETVVYQHNVINQRRVPAMRWATEYMRRPDAAAYVQAHVGIYRDTGVADFDAVIVTPLAPPERP